MQAFIYSKSDPALENCTGVVIAPYNFRYPLARSHFEAAKFDINDSSSKNQQKPIYLRNMLIFYNFSQHLINGAKSMTLPPILSIETGHLCSQRTSI